MTCSATDIHRTTAAADSAIVLLARITDVDGKTLAAADLAGATLAITDLEQGTTVTRELTPTDVLYDELQTDARWTADATGYNVAVVVDGTDISLARTTYQVDLKLTPSASPAVVATWQLQTYATYV